MSHTFRSIFDIIGPVMVGPSSSHTAGALALGKAAAQLFEVKPKKVDPLLRIVCGYPSRSRH